MMAKAKEITKISDLLPDANNYNKGTEFGSTLIEKSIRNLGAGRSILLDKNGKVIAGNKTLEGLVQAGFDDNDIIVVQTTGKQIVAVQRTDLDLDTKRGKEMALADNATSKANLSWDHEAMSADFESVELEEWGVFGDESEGGFGDNSLNSEAKEDDYKVPVEIKTDIKAGDVFEIGKHRLICGDSTDPDVIERLMEGRKANIVVTDPDFSMDIEAVKKCYENTKNVLDGVSFWICGDKQAVQLASNDFENFAKFFVQDFRQATLIANNQPMTRHVMICQFGRRAMNNLHDGFSTLLQIATDRTSEVHKTTPMSKKVELPSQFISHYSESGDIVLDIFSHSGSTMVASEQLGRICYGVELEPKYCQCIIERMQKNLPELKMTRNGQIFKNSFHN